MATTPGLSKLDSRSRAGGSDVLLSFQWGTDMNAAVQDVRKALQTTYLPDDVQRPLILRYDPTIDPVLRIALSSTSKEYSLTELRGIAERTIKRDLEAMDGVAAVRIRGGTEPEAQVLLHEDWLVARGLTINQVIQEIGSPKCQSTGRVDTRGATGIYCSYPQCFQEH